MVKRTTQKAGFSWRFVAATAFVGAMAGLTSVGVFGQDADESRRWASLSEDELVDSLLSVMTVEEKLGQLTQYTGQWSVTGPTVPQGGEAEIRAGRIGSFLNIVGAQVTRDVQRIAVEESRLGIPLIFGHDVIHGYRTIFPVPLAEAATWNPDAVEHAARIAAREASSAGVHWTFAPMVDLARDARWGRIVEGSGEDPYLGSVMAVARVRGFQGKDISADSTLVATAKHFAAYGGAEAGRDYNTVDVSERTLREMFLPPYRAAVDAGVQTLMSAFNEVGGVPATASHYLFTEILRDEWGFDGMVVADYTAVRELIEHGVAADSTQAGILALTAGVDMSMVDGIYAKKLPAVAGSEALPMSVIDRAVERVLRTKHRAGLFDNPYRYNDVDREARTLLAPSHRAFARRIAAQSIVLLKNDDVLPFSRGLRSIAVVGALAADSLSALGSWAALGRAEEAVSILAGLRRAFSETEIVYEPGYQAASGGFNEIIATMLDEDTTGFDSAIQAVRRSDAVVLVLGEHREMSGEAASRTDIGLPGAQLALAKRVLAAADDRPVVVLLANGRPLAVPYLAEHAPAILETWYLGTETGNAVADVLLGEVNPSGKLPVSFPHSTGQAPVYYNHRPTGRPPSPTEKYTSKYLDVPWTPLYPFGYGLSYTTFEIDNLQVQPMIFASDGEVAVTVDVANTGDVAGAEVVQLYVRDEVASVTRPVKELKAFERVELAAGETRTVRFTLTPDMLAFWGPDGGWITEPGSFVVYVGSSSEDVVEASFELLPD